MYSSGPVGKEAGLRGKRSLLKETDHPVAQGRFAIIAHHRSASGVNGKGSVALG